MSQYYNEIDINENKPITTNYNKQLQILQNNNRVEKPFSKKEIRVQSSNSLKSVFKERKKHLQLLDKYTKVNYIGQYICTLCQTRHTSAKSLEDHRASRGHINNLNQQNQQQLIQIDPDVRVTDVQHPALDVTGILIEVKIDPEITIKHEIKNLNNNRYFLVDFSSKYTSFAIQIPSAGNIIDLQERTAENVNFWLCQLFFSQ